MRMTKVAEVAAKRPNKFGPHYMIWMDSMDAALALTGMDAERGGNR
jgi:hypothetical protein